VTSRGSFSEGATSGPRLRFVSDDEPGIRRRRAGKGFSYSTPDGSRLTDAETLGWIRSLAVPPAWRDVWISPHRNGHILATGRDARGRKQYRYHPKFRAQREGAKFAQLAQFGRALPVIRRRVDADLRRAGLPREKVLAAVVALLETTRIRVGNEAYARDNRSFGLTTLRRRHVEVDGSALTFSFRGKSGKAHRIGLEDRRLARVVRHCQELPGQRLFTYENGDGTWQAVSSDDVNEYLRAASSQEISAKDFRTWSGTLLAYAALREGTGLEASGADGSDGSAGSDRERRSVFLGVLSEVADRLGNTVAICRRSYVHPAVETWFLAAGDPPRGRGALRRHRPYERELIALLEQAARGG
jgi:DNA topoisomerase-1